MNRATMQMAQDYLGRIKELEKENEELKHNKKTVVHLADCLEEKMKERIEELEQQIEEMKCCNNCKFDSLEPPEVISNGVCENCINHSKWELQY